MPEKVKLVYADTPEEFATTLRDALAEVAVENGTGDTYGVQYQRATESPRFSALIHYWTVTGEESE